MREGAGVKICPVCSKPYEEMTLERNTARAKNAPWQEWYKHDDNNYCYRMPPKGTRGRKQ